MNISIPPFRVLPLLLACACVIDCGPASGGDPADSSTTPQLPGWGILIDAHDECEVVHEGNSLAMSLPGTYRDLWPDRDHVDSPRILRDATGDFTVMVRISAGLSPTSSERIDGAISTAAFRAATLLIWRDAGNFVRLDRAGMIKDGALVNTVYFHVFADGQRVVERALVVRDAETWLCLRRRGPSVTAYYRQDSDVGWQSLPAATIGFPDEVQTGVAIINNVAADFTARFDDFSVGD